MNTGKAAHGHVGDMNMDQPPCHISKGDFVGTSDRSRLPG